ncbi:MAG: hypothetical protein HYZ49_10950 [Chloroflexi bacterium]|nr:hypothetical protein [Chloroflexota bacterium]
MSGGYGCNPASGWAGSGSLPPSTNNSMPAVLFGGLKNWSNKMTGSASLTPLLFVMVIVLILVWQTLGNIRPEYYFLHWIGTPWRIPPVIMEPVAVASPRALMVWADEDSAGEKATQGWPLK